VPPNPGNEYLGGRILQPFDLIEIMMVQLFVERRKSGLDFCKIYNKPRWLKCPHDMNFEVTSQAV